VKCFKCHNTGLDSKPLNPAESHFATLFGFANETKPEITSKHHLPSLSIQKNVETIRFMVIITTLLSPLQSFDLPPSFFSILLFNCIHFILFFNCKPNSQNISNYFYTLCHFSTRLLSLHLCNIFLSISIN